MRILRIMLGILLIILLTVLLILGLFLAGSIIYIGINGIFKQIEWANDYNPDCLKRIAKDYCESIDMEFRSKTIIPEVFYCHYERESKRKVLDFKDYELERCKK